MDTLYYQLHELWGRLQGPLGLAAVVLICLVPVTVLMFNRSKWAVLTVILYVAGLGRPLVGGSFFKLVSFLQPLVTASRPLITFLFLVLLLPALRVQGDNWRKRLWLAGTVLFCVFEFALALRDIFGGSMDRGVLSLINFALIFLVLVVGVSRWIQSVADAEDAIKCVCAASILFVIGTAAQIASGSDYLLNSRLTATAANPNFAAEAITAGLPATLYMIVRKGRSPVWRIVAAGAAGLLLLMLVWTGSRGGAFRCLIALFIMFRRRMGSFIIAGTAIGLVVYGSLALYGSQIQLGRILTFTDTRSAVWFTLLRGFLENPVFGIGSESVGSENSYLMAASHAGLMALGPLLFGVAMIVQSLIKMRPRRTELGDNALLLDMAAAGIVSVVAGAFFDGYLTANFSPILFTFFIYLAILAFVRDGLDTFGSASYESADRLEGPAQLDGVSGSHQEPVYG